MEIQETNNDELKKLIESAIFLIEKTVENVFGKRALSKAEKILDSLNFEIDSTGNPKTSKWRAYAKTDPNAKTKNSLYGKTTIYVVEKYFESNKNRFALLETVIHEIAHAFSRLGTQMKETRLIEEPFANLFVEICINYAKNNNIDIPYIIKEDKDTIMEDRSVFECTDTYKSEGEFLKSLLFLLRKNKADIKVIKDYFFGTKTEYQNICEKHMGNDYINMLYWERKLGGIYSIQDLKEELADVLIEGNEIELLQEKENNNLYGNKTLLLKEALEIKRFINRFMSECIKLGVPTESITEKDFREIINKIKGEGQYISNLGLNILMRNIGMSEKISIKTYIEILKTIQKRYYGLNIEENLMKELIKKYRADDFYSFIQMSSLEEENRDFRDLFLGMKLNLDRIKQLGIISTLYGYDIDKLKTNSFASAEFWKILRDAGYLDRKQMASSETELNELKELFNLLAVPSDLQLFIDSKRNKGSIGNLLLLGDRKEEFLTQINEAMKCFESQGLAVENKEELINKINKEEFEAIELNFQDMESQESIIIPEYTIFTKSPIKTMILLDSTITGFIKRNSKDNKIGIGEFVKIADYIINADEIYLRIETQKQILDFLNEQLKQLEDSKDRECLIKIIEECNDLIQEKEQEQIGNNDEEQEFTEELPKTQENETNQPKKTFEID